MSPGDLKVGMWLTNQGPGSIVVWEKLPGNNPIVGIKPGEEIGQICDILAGPGGTVIAFTSERINNALNYASLLEKITYYMTFGLIQGAGAVKYAEVAANVSDAQVQQQADAIRNAEQNGINISNSITKVVSGVVTAVEDTLLAAIPWKVLGVVGIGWLLFVNRDKAKLQTSKH